MILTNFGTLLLTEFCDGLYRPYIRTNEYMRLNDTSTQRSYSYLNLGSSTNVKGNTIGSKGVSCVSMEIQTIYTIYVTQNTSVILRWQWDKQKKEQIVGSH